MNRELLLRNPENVAAIFDLLWSHIAITTGDGIQADGSFHFHGNQLYSGGYGADEAVQLATICQLTSGLAGFAPPPAAFDIVSLYLLNGTQYILRTGPNGTFFDLSTKGREITRAPDGNLAFPSAVFIQALNSTIFLDSAHGAEYKALLDQVAGIGRPFVGARHFYRSDCMFFLYLYPPYLHPSSSLLSLSYSDFLLHNHCHRHRHHYRTFAVEGPICSSRKRTLIPAPVSFRHDCPSSRLFRIAQNGVNTDGRKRNLQRGRFPSASFPPAHGPCATTHMYTFGIVV